MNKDEVVIICHDEYAQTWDILYIDRMNKGIDFPNCIDDYCDYERYLDTDIVNLTNKVINDWNNVKNEINKIIKNNEFEYAKKMNGFCMIIKEQ